MHSHIRLALVVILIISPHWVLSIPARRRRGASPERDGDEAAASEERHHRIEEENEALGRECAICTNEVTEPLAPFPCGHGSIGHNPVCTECRSHLRRRRCPICRARLPRMDHHDVPHEFNPSQHKAWEKLFFMFLLTGMFQFFLAFFLLLIDIPIFSVVLAVAVIVIGLALHNYIKEAQLGYVIGTISFVVAAVQCSYFVFEFGPFLLESAIEMFNMNKSAPALSLAIAWSK